MNIRVGQGFDVHPLAEGIPFWLGGVQLKHTHGAVGHSDADAMLHAVCDALLGAANMKDIGFHFPNTDERFRGIDSKVLLKETNNIIQTKGYKVGNIDCTICLEAPKIAPYIPAMQKAIAEVLGIEEDCIAVKATTAEKLGFVGRKEGVVALATVLLYK